MKKRQYYPDAQQYNPWRPPDWRWQRATEIVAGGRNASTRKDDPATCRAVGCLRALRRCTSERGVKSLAKRQPDFVMALKLHEEGGARVTEVHARVLARQTPSSIAYAMGLTADAVETYLDMFFTIGDRIDAPAYIVDQVIGVRADGTPPTTEQLMLAAAYHHGLHALEAWIDFLQHAGEQHDLTTREGRTRESIELSIAAHTLPTDTDTICRLAMKAPFVLETHRKYVRSRPVAEVFFERANKILDEIPWAAPPNRQISGAAKTKTVVAGDLKLMSEEVA